LREGLRLDTSNFKETDVREELMGRVALVTGGSRGIGEAISKALKAAGYTVAANYAGNDEKAAAFTKDTGIPTYKWNVADYAASKEGIAKVEADLGPIDVVVGNAGITRDAPFHKMTRNSGTRSSTRTSPASSTPSTRSGAACATAASGGSSSSPRSTARRARRAR